MVISNASNRIVMCAMVLGFMITGCTLTPQKTTVDPEIQVGNVDVGHQDGEQENGNHCAGGKSGTNFLVAQVYEGKVKYNQEYADVYVREFIGQNRKAGDTSIQKMIGHHKSL